MKYNVLDLSRRQFSLVASKIIYQAYVTAGYQQFLILGPQGTGKTTYALLVMYDIYRDWDTVLQHFFYDPTLAFKELKLLTQKLKSIIKTDKDKWFLKRIKVICFDDAGIWLSKYWYSINPRLVLLINSIFDFIRSNCAACLFTCPDADILKTLRKKSWYRVKVAYRKKFTHSDRVAIGYKANFSVTGRTFVRKVFEDYFKTSQLPSDVRKEVLERRFEAQERLYKIFERLNLDVEIRNGVLEVVSVREGVKRR